jgi:hypothetical protein
MARPTTCFPNTHCGFLSSISGRLPGQSNGILRVMQRFLMAVF